MLREVASRMEVLLESRHVTAGSRNMTEKTPGYIRVCELPAVAAGEAAGVRASG